jgi:gliding motility-associated-like protein
MKTMNSMKKFFTLLTLIFFTVATGFSQIIPVRQSALITPDPQFNDIASNKASSNPDYSPITVPNAFSPNGDGINDYFRIAGIEKYPDARLFVYTASNRKVYEKNHYGNIDFWGSEIDALWNGTNNIKGTGMQLPNGTYIFILDLANGNQKLIKLGTVFIKR